MRKIVFSLSSSTDWFILHRLCSLFNLATSGGRLFHVTPTWNYISVCKHTYMTIEIKSKRNERLCSVWTITECACTHGTRDKENRRMLTTYEIHRFPSAPYTMQTNSTKVYLDRQNHLVFFICLFARQLALSAAENCFQDNKQHTAHSSYKSVRIVFSVDKMSKHSKWGTIQCI